MAGQTAMSVNGTLRIMISCSSLFVSRDVLSRETPRVLGRRGGRQPRGAGLNLGGLIFATQAVRGALGVARNDANTRCAQGDASVTKWPIPGN